MDRVILAALVAVLALVAGCGGDDEPQRLVRLRIEEPGELATLRADSVKVRGSVSPADASVRVRGERANVSGRSFEADVRLEPGVNVIDVIASADGARPAMQAVRVRRQVTVEVPDLVGFSPSDALDRLEALGLKGDVDETGDILDLVLPGEPFVCETDPSVGTTVNPGSKVTLRVAERC